MDIYNEFIAQKKDLVFYAGKPIINKRHAFYDFNNDPWDFSQSVGLSFKIWEERDSGLLMIDWSDPVNLSSSGNEIILNAPTEDTSIERGKYYYEIEYYISGGYPILMAYGEAKFI